MIKIAICDDEPAICGQVESILMNLLDKKSIQYEIDVYHGGTGLCQKLETQCYDLLFLDIELPKQNGIEIGQFIRDVLRNEQLQIAYISSNTNYALELFQFRPINFLVKPLTDEKLKQVLDKYLLLSNQQQQLFTYKKKTDYIKVPLQDIIYFESISRKVMIHTTSYTDIFYDTLDSIYSLVKGNQFLFIHKSTIVNCRYIKKLAYEEVTLWDDTILPISQSRRKDIKKMYLQMQKEAL